MSVLTTIEDGAIALGKAVEADALAAWKTVEGIAVADAQAMWNDFKPYVLAVPPTLYADLKTVIVGVVTAIGKGAPLQLIQDTLMSLLAAGETQLLAQAKALEGTALQIIIQVVLKSIP